MNKESLKTKSKELWEKYEAKIVLVLGLILIAVISFEVGALKGSNFSQKPLIIEKPTNSAVTAGNVATSTAPAQAQKLTTGALTDSTSPIVPLANCAYVGSKNSTMYHLATSSYAKNIKPENRVCFSSTDEAQSKGYQPDKSLSK